jgi:hypothetical protein
MKQTIAKRSFKKRFGQANHLLITTLIGLDAIENGTIKTKPESFSTTWKPKSPKRSAQRARIFTLQSFLGRAVESLEMYLTELNRKPKELESPEFTSLYSKADTSIFRKATLIGDKIQVDPVLIALMEVLITWRNYVFHYDIDNQIRPQSLSVLKENHQLITERFCGLNVEQLKETWENGGDFSFKETASLISATHDYVVAVDAYALKHLDEERYICETITGSISKNTKRLQKYKSLPVSKRTRYLSSLIMDHAGVKLNPSKIEAMAKLLSHNIQ